MAQRRPLTGHPAFVPLVALWLGALLGLVALVVPIEWLAWVPDLPGVPMRAEAAGLLAVAGVTLGYLAARAIAHRGRMSARRSLPSPDHFEQAVADEPAPLPRATGPLRIREEFSEGFDVPDPATLAEEPEPDAGGEVLPGPAPMAAERVPAPQIPPPGAAQGGGLDDLLRRFDRALDSYSRRVANRAEFGPDPVQSFVARQTGGPVPEEPGLPAPDHQAELRKALAKLARLHGRG